MNARLRIAAIRVYEKCKKNPEMTKKLGISATLNSNNITIMDTKSAISKGPEKQNSKHF